MAQATCGRGARGAADRNGTDAIIRLPAICICGSDLWPYRGLDESEWPMPMGHEYVGIVEEVGSQVAEIKPGQFVVGSFFASDNTCEICRSGYQSSCVNREPVGAIGRRGSLPASHSRTALSWPRSFLAASDVLGTSRASRADLEPSDRPGQGFPSRSAARRGCCRLPGHGRTASDQGAAPPVTSEGHWVTGSRIVQTVVRSGSTISSPVERSR
jgi:hypothetical protein